MVIGLIENQDINSYINFYMVASKNAKLTASVRHTEQFSKSAIPIYNSEVPDTAGGKTRRRRTRIIAKHYVFHSNTTVQKHECLLLWNSYQLSFTEKLSRLYQRDLLRKKLVISIFNYSQRHIQNFVKNLKRSVAKTVNGQLII